MGSADLKLRQHLVYLLTEGGAHLGFEQATDDLPVELHGASIDGFPHTPWQLIEHLRICQWDILEFSRNPRHVSPEFPKGCWPDGDSPSNEAAWDASVEAFRSDLRSMVELVENPGTDLYAKIPHGDGQTILREAMLVADHNAYHIGQLVVLRQCLGAWH